MVEQTEARLERILLCLVHIRFFDHALHPVCRLLDRREQVVRKGLDLPLVVTRTGPGEELVDARVDPFEVEADVGDRLVVAEPVLDDVVEDRLLFEEPL